MDDKIDFDPIIINEAQLVLAEKRTSLALMRTGIAVLALPMTVFSFLIATSKYYNVTHVLPLLIPVMILNICLIAFGVFLIARAIIRMKHYDHFLYEIKKKNREVGELIE